MIVWCQKCETSPVDFHAQAQESFKSEMHRPLCIPCLLGEHTKLCREMARKTRTPPTKGYTLSDVYEMRREIDKHRYRPLHKIAPVIKISEELIEQTPTLEQIMRGVQRRDERRRQEKFAELLFGAHLNPCIVLGEN